MAPLVQPDLKVLLVIPVRPAQLAQPALPDLKVLLVLKVIPVQLARLAQPALPDLKVLPVIPVRPAQLAQPALPDLKAMQAPLAQLDLRVSQAQMVRTERKELPAQQVRPAQRVPPAQQVLTEPPALKVLKALLVTTVRRARLDQREPMELPERVRSMKTTISYSTLWRAEGKKIPPELEPKGQQAKFILRALMAMSLLESHSMS